MKERSERMSSDEGAVFHRLVMNSYEVKAITRKETEPFIIGIHYAKR